MKLLIIGIDGGDRRIIDAMPMPYMRRLLTESQHFAAVEDLFARGWAKILCGRAGTETGAFYAKPEFVPDACGATGSWSARDYGRTGVKPLWEKLNELGLSVGFMNVPTTYPAPTVDGFFIAGAGGGIGDGVMPPEAYHPPTVVKVLQEVDYIFDTRYVTSGIRELHALVAHLRRMTERRIDAYERLTKQHSPDVGFIAFMGPTRLQYLAMQQIEAVISAQGGDARLSSEQELVVGLYQHFDGQVERLIQSVQPEQVMVVSDHGQAAHTHDVDFGAFLREQGWQHLRSEGMTSLQGSMRRLAKRFLPRATVKRLSKQPMMRRAAGAQSRVDFRMTKAFGLRHVPGIYINDERFGGAVRGASERNALVEQIANTLNAHPVALEHGLHAKPFRGHVQAEKAVEPLLPDIWVDLPDGYMADHGVGNSGPGLSSLVARNPAYDRPIDYAEVKRDQWTGMKGRYPILSVYGAHRAIELQDPAGDLTDAYQMALALASGR